MNDPANILADVVGSLRAHADAFDHRIESAEPADNIEMPPDRFPTTRDRNELYVDPNPVAPPMQSLPHPQQEWAVSATSEADGLSRPEWRTAPPIFFGF